MEKINGKDKRKRNGKEKCIIQVYISIFTSLACYYLKSKTWWMKPPDTESAGQDPLGKIRWTESTSCGRILVLVRCTQC